MIRVRRRILRELTRRLEDADSSDVIKATLLAGLFVFFGISILAMQVRQTWPSRSVAHIGTMIALPVVVLMFVTAGLSRRFEGRRWFDKGFVPVTVAALGTCFVAGFYLIALFAMKESFFFALSLTPFVAAVVMIVLIPGYSVVLFGFAALPLALMRRPRETIAREFCWIGAVVTPVSFSTTLVALAVGRTISPSSQIPQTAQLLFANIGCDFLSMYLAFGVLERILRSKSPFAVPVGLAVVFATTSTLAFASLWLGVANSQFAVTPFQAARVFVGLSPLSSGYDLGGMFFAMHTVFVPIASVLVVLLLLWLAKLVATVAAWLLRRGREDDIDPLGLTSAFWGLLAAVCAWFAFIIERIRG